MTNEQIGQRIKELRYEKGLSQEELARRIELPRTAVTKIESGSQEVRFRELEKFAEALNIPLTTLVEEEPPLLESYDSAFSMVSESCMPEYRPAPDALRTILLLILQRTAGDPQMNERHLAATVQNADLMHRKAYGETITKRTYANLTELQQAVQKTLNEMVEANELTKVSSIHSSKPRYLPQKRPNLQELTAAEYVMIEKAICTTAV